MTTTTAPPQQPRQQDAPSDTALIAAIIAAFLLLHSARAITARLRAPFSRAGVSPSALKAAIALVLSMPQQPMEGTGPATRWAVRVNETRRGAYALAAMRRIQRAVDDARAQGEPVNGAIGAALARERTYWAQHIAASQHRVAATSAVDGMAGTYGNLLSWRTVRDANVTPGCLAADGKNWRVDDPPVIEGNPSFPGAVHARCRCKAGPPRRGAPVMPGLGAR